MNVSGSSGVTAALLLQRLFAKEDSTSLSTQQELQGARQTLPDGGAKCSMDGAGGAKLSDGTLSGMVGLQMGPPSAGDIASNLVDSLDTDGDGALSQSEIEAAFKAAGIEGDVGSALSSLDTDGDAALSVGELTTAIDTDMKAHQGRPHGGPPPGGPPPGGPPEVAAGEIISAFDTDGDGGLNLSEILAGLGTGLGQDSASDSQTTAFSALDADGDGSLSLAELTSALQSTLSEGLDAYARTAALG